MECGGCAAKVGPSPLAAALGRLAPSHPDPSVLLGLAAGDDAAAVRTPSGDVVLATVDAFRAFVDDPWRVGRVAAVNAVSDLLAKGASPRHALAMVTVPWGTPGQNEEVLYQVMAGVRAALDPLGVSLVGGHSTAGPELFVGLSVTGDAAPGGRRPFPEPGRGLAFLAVARAPEMGAAARMGRARLGRCRLGRPGGSRELGSAGARTSPAVPEHRIPLGPPRC